MTSLKVLLWMILVDIAVAWLIFAIKLRRAIVEDEVILWHLPQAGWLLATGYLTVYWLVHL